MGFSEAIRTVYKDKYATFSGRASRSEYWWSILGIMLFALIAAGIILLVGGANPEPSTLSVISMGLFGLLYLAAVIPMIAVVIRRLHDRDMSGWWYLGFIVASLIPYVGILVSIGFLVLMCLKGTDGENRFGPDPLDNTAGAEVFS